MAMMLKPKSSDAAMVPDGTYRATLSKVTEFENAYGPRIGFEFTLLGAAVEGQMLMRSTSPNLSPAGKLADVLRGMLARDLTPDEMARGIDVEALVGRECSVLVLSAKAKNGNTYSSVERVFPAAMTS